MTSALGLLGVFADAVILLALVAAIASRGASHVARALIATVAFAAAWLSTAVFDALRAPDWTIFTGGAVIAASIIVITVTIHLWTLEGDGGESDRGQPGDDGGGGPRRRRPDAPQHGGGSDDPICWPEFERQVAFYVAAREREEEAVKAASSRPPSQFVESSLCAERRAD